MAGVIASGSLTVDPGGEGYNVNSPIIGYHNIVTEANITATTEDADHLAINLANPATHLYWASGAGSPSSDEYLTVTTGTTDPVDYIGVARHNFGTAQAPVSVEAQATSGGAWSEIVAPSTPTDDGPLILRWTPAAYFAVRLRIAESQSPGVMPFCAVLYLGRLLMLQRRIYVGHAPITYNQRVSVANHRSVAGHFLGRIILGRQNQSSISLQHLTPTWFRQQLWPFIQAAQEDPFFFAWRPFTYSTEAGYAWMTNDPSPSNAMVNGMMQVGFDIEGVI